MAGAPHRTDAGSMRPTGHPPTPPFLPPPPPPPLLPPVLPPDGRRAGAVWVAATGALLLFASAAVFLAVSWDRLGDAGRMAVVATMTGACLGVGRSLARRLPGTAGVLLHLGAFLLPVDLAGVAPRLHLGWPGLVLAEGLLGLSVLALLARDAGSPVLWWAVAVSGPVTALGISAVSPLPGTVLLAVVALGCVAANRLPRASVAWAIAAGYGSVLGPMTALVLSPLRTGHGIGLGVLRDLSMTGPQAAPSAAIAGIVAATALGILAARRRDLGLATLAAGAAVVGGIGGWASTRPPASLVLLGAAGILLVIQIVAILARHDRFWSRPADSVAAAGLGISIFPTTIAAVFVAAPRLTEKSAGPAFSAAIGVLALTWIVSGARHRLTTAERRAPDEPVRIRLGGPLWADLGALLCAAAAALVSGGGMVAEAATLTGLGCLFVLSGRRTGLDSGLVALVAAPMAAAGLSLGGAAGGFAPVRRTIWFGGVGALRGVPSSRHPAGLHLIGLSHPLGVVLCGMAGAAVLAAAVTIRRIDPGVVRSDAAVWRLADGDLRPAAALGSLVCAALAAGGAATFVSGPWVAAGFALMCWALAEVFDVSAPGLGDGARVAMGMGVLAGAAARPVTVAIAAGLAALALLADGIRLGRPRLAATGAVMAPIALLAAGVAAGVPVGSVGLAVATSAVVWLGLAAAITGRWALPSLSGAAASACVGLLASTADARSLATTLILVGVLGAGSAIAARRPDLAAAASTLAAGGTWLHLGLSGVVATEPYLMPVTIGLLAFGAFRRHESQAEDIPIGSWSAYGFPIVVLGGAAFAERLGGGSGWHAILAGAVGVAAVAWGGARRLSAPLLVGTVLVVAVTVHEALGGLAGTPTWAWLALGGGSLLATGIGLERSDSTPIDAGRRLVDSISANFE